MADTPAEKSTAPDPRVTQPAAWSLVVAHEVDERFLGLLLEAFRSIYAQHFSDDLWIVNHNLPIDVRALRHTDPWRIALVLTPWMLARFFSPLRDPHIELPDGWHASDRSGASYTVIGPPIAFSVLGQEQTAYLNYHPQLGHYLIQPLVQSMQQYASAEAVYAAWSEVIRSRDETIRARQLECKWQSEVSRREFFTGLRGPRDHDDN
ncbi:MAG: [NiFe]-hydrogenase assembly chaperone HybE [Gammaproteobacteria bacterium]|jgi:[NiFe]-hydrogenase assembly, chaperone, HybE